MNVKKQVFEYLTKYPEATTTDLVTAFPDATKKSLWNYSGQWKKNQGIQLSRGRNSIRQRVFSYIDSNPDATSKDLQNAFPNENRVSISNYHYQWRKVRPDRKKKKSVKKIVFTYLNRNPQATYRELTKALPGINPSSASAYQSIWKQRIPSAGNNSNDLANIIALDINGVQKSSQALIETLRSTIETQKTAIEIMREQNALLKRIQSGVLAELDEVSDHEWQQLRETISIFIRGLREN